jgi:gliding motility-associated-like protein
MYSTLNKTSSFGKIARFPYLVPFINKNMSSTNFNMIKYLKKSVLALLFLLPFVFTAPNAEATHYMGADITYKCIDSFKFEVTLKWYRDCRGVALANSAITVRCSNGGSVNVTPSLISIREITPVCATATGGCVPTNTRFSGEGVEEHTYRVTMDFNTSPLSALKNCSGKITFGSIGYARNSTITTGAANQNLWTDAELDLKNAPCNNSPTLTSEPIAILCCNQPFFFNNGALDNTDFDSLSYSWGHPRSAISTNIGYSGSFAYNYPFTVYDPRNPQQPTNPIPGSTPPIGLYLDLTTGDIILTPVSCNEVTVAVINVTEWRKDTAGVYKEIGRTQRDLQFIVKSCPDNNPPTIDGPFTYKVCEGEQLCFDVTTDDITFQPPPPASAPADDTVKISWNNAIPGASFSVINPTGLHQTGRFCWQPGANTASDLPYNFTVTARDNSCPLNAVTVRAFRITVKFNAQAIRTRDTLPCGVYAVESNPKAGFRGTPGYNWSILDSSGNTVLNRKIAKFKSSNQYFSTKQKDTLVFTKGGFYIIEHTINNAPSNCPTVYRDTLIVPPLLEADLSLGKDTFVCAGTELLFRPSITNYTAPLTYQWSTMGVNNDGTYVNNATKNPINNKDTFRLRVPGVQYDTAVSIFITDGIGCTAVDSVQVFLKANPIAILPPDNRICTYDSFTVVPNLANAYWIDPIGDTLAQGDTLYKEWFFNGNTVAFSVKDSVRLNVAGMYVLRVEDSIKCFDTDTFLLAVNDTVKALAGPDQVLCFNDSLIITANGIDTAGTGKSGLYQWRDITPPNNTLMGTNRTYKQIASVNKNFRLVLSMTQSGKTCVHDDSVNIKVNALPIVKVGDPRILCCDYGELFLNPEIKTPTGTPATGSWSIKARPQLLKNNAFLTDSACAMIDPTIRFITTYALYTYIDPATLCVNKDSMSIRVNSLPNITLNERTYCQDKIEVSLDGEVVLSPANTSLGTPSWRCLDSNSSVNKFTQNMLVNKGTSFNPKFWLNVDEANYTIQNASGTDTVILEFKYVDPFGCTNRKTVNIIIAKVPKILFPKSPPLCWDDGNVSLNTLTGVNLTDGVWSCLNSPGFRPCSELGGITGDTINTKNSVPLASSTSTPNKWELRYTHTSSGCPTFNDTTIIINPLPNITLNSFPATQYCENTSDISISTYANPSGGTWSASDPAALIGGNTFSPSKALVKNTPIFFRYTFTSPVTGCKNKDSISVIVDPKPTITIPDNQEFCRTELRMVENLNMPVTATNTSGLIWGAVPSSASSSRVTLGTDPSAGSVILALQNNATDTFKLFASAGGLGSCGSETGAFQVIVHPLPDASITNDNPNGCNPVTSNLGVIITNTVDPTTSTYRWIYNSTTSTMANPSTTYNTDGTQDISVTVSSNKGCDTTLNSTVDVYPIPVADFRPSPDNYTTAALPRFAFNNKSSVANVLNSTIITNEWDFGDLLISTDTSTELNPSYYYSTDTGSYVVTLNVTTNHGCTNSFSYPVVVGPDLIVFIPNAFTPDNAGPSFNEGFKAIISGDKSMELTIFNRWGEIMFQTTDKNKEWDGTYKGLPVQQDVYAYSLKVTSLNDDPYTYSGTITLVR